MKQFLFQNDSMEHFFSVCVSVKSNRIRCLANTPYVYSYMNLAFCHQKTIYFFNSWIDFEKNLHEFYSKNILKVLFKNF